MQNVGKNHPTPTQIQNTVPTGTEAQVVAILRITSRYRVYLGGIYREMQMNLEPARKPVWNLDSDPNANKIVPPFGRQKSRCRGHVTASNFYS